MSEPLLTLHGVEASYGLAPVLYGVDLSVGEGEIVSLLGRNGAGKTTVIRTICGLLRPSAGRIAFRGRDVTRESPVAIVQAGIATVPEGRRVFPSLTVEENLALGGYSRRQGLRLAADCSEIFGLFPRLAERRRQPAGTLSGGEQQMLAIGRALMSKPTLLLLDEPSMGLAPMLIDAIFDTINGLARQGITILLVEQNASAALDLADKVYLLERGRIVRSGMVEDLQGDAEIRDSYLGAA